MKYAPLGAWLAQQPAAKREITLRFDEIEEILGAKLPKSAATYREWWANQEYGTHAPHWQGAGFEVDAVDLSRRFVRFRRNSAGKSRRSPASKAKQPKLKPQARQTIHKMESLLHAGFGEVGDWELKDGKIRIAGDIPAKPGVYAHVVDGSIYYIGSATMGLKKRLYFYARPGRTQRTSIRINALIAEALAAGKKVSTIAAFPEDSAWNELPVCGVTGLEAGLVRKLCPPWNKRGLPRNVNGSAGDE